MTSSPHRIHEASVYAPPAGRRYKVQCPECHAPMGFLPEIGPRVDASLTCPRCLLRIRSEHGIWNALSPERLARYKRFLAEYEFVRQQEGRGSEDPAYYFALPDRDLTGRNQCQWTIRARTFHHFERHILSALERTHPGGMDILDLGAGNGWLSYRLSLRAHRAVAVDLSVDSADGLAAASHFANALPSMFLRVRAEFNRLPFADDQFDCAIFNASFHYSEAYEQTLNELLRCVRSGGAIIICDTPWYSKENSGRQMLEERRATFIDKYGFPSDSLASREFLTDSILRNLERCCGIRWHIDYPFYGLRWALRPLIARIQRRREPSRFRIYVAEVRK